MPKISAGFYATTSNYTTGLREHVHPDRDSERTDCIVICGCRATHLQERVVEFRQVACGVGAVVGEALVVPGEEGRRRRSSKGRS